MRLRHILFIIAALCTYGTCAGVAWIVSHAPAAQSRSALNGTTRPGQPNPPLAPTSDANRPGSSASHTAGEKLALLAMGADPTQAKVASASPGSKSAGILGGVPSGAQAASRPTAAVSAHPVQVAAVTYRRLAESCLENRQYQTAAQYYRLEAAVYRQQNDANTARVEENKADRWATEIGLYVDTVTDRQELISHYSGAKFEPLYGCYLGAYAESDYTLPRLSDVSVDSPTYHEQALGAVIGKPLATAFCYCFYGDPFPLKWAQALCRAGIAPHVALEPNDGLQYVRNDRYLRQFARDAASCGGPLFLRFASEMNGNWTAYHQSPELYRSKFRLVHDVMSQIAPNVAMMWCVYNSPEQNIDDYYPGDAYVDWVGVNFYSVFHHDNDPSSPAWFENPTVSLRYVYAKYASRKPIAICEYGASHREQLNTAVDHSDFVAVKLAELFNALPREYPRVKLIDVFDCNNIAFAPPGRQLNDYCVTDSPAVLGAFQQAIASSYYLSHVAQAALPARPVMPRPLQTNSSLGSKVRFTAWVKTYVAEPTVVYSVDGHPVARHNSPGDYGLLLDTSQLPGTQHLLTIQVFDSDGMIAGQKQVMLSFSPAPRSRHHMHFQEASLAASPAHRVSTG